ncbi:MAG: hypothetical protein AAF532_05855 [Planctomycetota bacterium]
MAETAEASSAPAPVEKIYLVSYPKVIMLYPTLVASLVMGLISLFAGPAAADAAEAAGTFDAMLGLIFLGVFTLNLIVLAFDFPRTTSLTLMFFLFAVGFGCVLLFRSYPDLLPNVTVFLQQLKPIANADFYLTIFGILTVIFICVFIGVQFDYWEIGPNELLHHHGIMSNLKRYAAPQLRVEKEIPDIFEYLLLRSGRLILHPSNEPRAIVLDNVPFIGWKEKKITKLLGALQVRVRTQN